MELTRICTTTSPNQTVETADLILYKRTTFRPVFTFKQPNGTPLPLTNIVVTFYIEDDDAVEILTIDSDSVTPNGSQVIITNVSNGTVDILITDEETSALTFVKANWWVSITLPNGDVFLRGSGDIYLKQPFE